MRDPARPYRLGCEHIGEQLRGPQIGHKMIRDLYAFPRRSQKQKPNRADFSDRAWEDQAWRYRDDDHAQHSDAYLLVQRDKALRNFDLSMRYFESLDQAEFESALEHVLAKGRTFKPVESLPAWDDVEGAYVMVFDDYKQFYIGQSNNVRKRIKQHWVGSKPFDRLINGDVYNSIFPVDELRALDTTRIYAARSTNPYAPEERAEKAADQRFCLNRMTGGEATPLTLMLTHSRTHGVASAPLSFEEYQRERDGLANTIAQTPPSHRSTLIAELAGMDMTIYSVTPETGAPFMWSRRDGIAGAVTRGELSVEEFTSFLGMMGEKVIWPKN
ncbi:GIY-YIG nuclease family protein [Crystallibacter degradans]|uniref:GIY-YIG nuclease family protein n=1 Tax=Crystallibacter degradans TaxID=2726743 RepID=UPI0014742473|nr:GIY-YIG nuclease family protein [Arthrobacter sp. SF27]NMR31957.1 GIY-YIG nuclease family protein [Arthrobacter sp. SF27]